MNRKLFIAILAFAAVAGGFILMQNLRGSGFNLPRGGETRTETVVIEGQQETVTKEIMITDDVKHTIPLDEILQGCPSRDCIPSIDDPSFVSVTEANDWLEDKEPGIAFSRGNTHRFYPFLILVRHELVNDTIEGKRILISYCPLCLTAIVFDPIVKGQESEFGVSGLLWKANLIMYDRNTDNLWSQVLAEAVVGDLAGTKLNVLPADQMLYENWKKVHPEGEVLSRKSGGFRGYGSNPYGGSYFDLPGISLSFAKPTDERLPFGAFVFGIQVNGKAKAYDIEAVKAKGVVEDEFEGEKIILRYDKDLDVVRMYRVLPSGEERLTPISGFWFSWAEAHPGTALYK